MQMAGWQNFHLIRKTTKKNMDTHRHISHTLGKFHQNGEYHINEMIERKH